MKYVYNPLSGQFDLLNIDKNYVHLQSIASTTWNIPHNLDKLCSIQIVDNSNNEITGDINWVDKNNVTITFNTAIAGKALCN
jgi:hypothetical protein